MTHDTVEAESREAILLEAVQRISMATPASTNSRDADHMASWTLAVARTALERIKTLPPIPTGGGEADLRFEDGVDASMAVRDWIDEVCKADLRGKPPGVTDYLIRTLTFNEDDGGAVIYSRNNMVRAAGMIVRDTHNFSVAMRMFGDDLPSPATGGDPISTAPTDGTLIDIWVEGPGSRWVQDCRWGKPIGANWGDRYGDDVGMADQWVTSAGFSLDRRNGVAAAWRLPSSATGGVETGAVEARAQELFASWRNDNGLICDADVSGHIPMKSGNYVFCSGCGESLTRRQVDMIARAKNDNQRASPPAVVSPAPTGEPVALDDLQAAFDEQFHAEWQAQYKSSMKRLGKVAMASEPFFNIARKLFASPVPIAGPTKEEILAAIEAAEDAVMLSRLEAGHPKRDACRLRPRTAKDRELPDGRLLRTVNTRWEAKELATDGWDLRSVWGGDVSVWRWTFAWSPKIVLPIPGVGNPALPAPVQSWREALGAGR